MARKKKKKKRSQSKSSQLSPEKYIRQKARHLPLDSCYINEDWEESGFASVVVVRAHKNGNNTMGIYLIDLKCLGVKETFYLFNEPDSRLKEIVNNDMGLEMTKIDYSLAHNIIYGSMKFAEKYGFKPHKLWSVTEHILEPDDENIPIVEIEFGDDGKPHYFSGPDDDHHYISRVMNTLEEYAGPGQYHFTALEDDSMDEYDDLDFEDDFYDVFDDPEFDEDLLEYIFGGNILDDGEGSFFESFRALSMLYLIAFPDEMPRILPTEIPVGVPIDDDKYELEPSEEEYIQHTIDSIYGKSKAHRNRELEKLRGRFSDSPEGLLLIYISWLGVHSEEPVSVVELIEQKYPDQVGYALFRSYRTTIEGDPEKGWEFLRKSLKIQDAFPMIEVFTSYEFEWFLMASIVYFTAINDLPTAMSYAGVLIAEVEEMEEEYYMADEAISILLEKLDDKLESVELPDHFDTPDAAKNRKNMRKL